MSPPGWLRAWTLPAVLLRPAGLDLIELSHLADKGTAVGGNQRLIRELEQRSKVKMADIEKDPKSFGYSSPLTEIAKVRCPILMISGKNDPNAPLPVMDDLRRQAAARPERKPTTYHPDNGPHGFYWGIPKIIPETAESTRRRWPSSRSTSTRYPHSPGRGATAQNGPAIIAAVAADSKRLEDGSMGQVTEFQGSSGTAIPAYIRKPKGAGPFPAVLILHGRTHRQRRHL